MSHLQLVINYRSFLNDHGVTCTDNQTKAVQEAFIRALIMYNSRVTNSFHFTDNAEECVWEQMDTWNAVFPINARFIFESARTRLATLHKELVRDGNISATNLYELVFDVSQTNAEGEQVPSKFVATECEQFTALVNYLYKELVTGNE